MKARSQLDAMDSERWGEDSFSGERPRVQLGAGSKLGSYLLEEILGAGGMGEV